jgi:hypothetical protein
MASIITRLIMDASQYNGGLQKAQKSLDKYIDKNMSMSNVMTKAAGSIAKMAGAVGIAMGGIEAMNKAIHSSQSLGDEWDNTINACKSSVDAFFQSLVTGNWDAFNGGILRTIANMKELSALRDSLADAKLSMGFNTRVFERDFARLEGIIDDQTKSIKERQAAFTELQSLINNFQRDVSDTQKGTEKTLLKSLSARFGRSDFTLEDINKYIAINNNDFSTREEKKALQNYQRQLKELQKRQYYAQTVGGGVAGGNVIMVENKNVTRQIELFKTQNAELEKQNILNNDNDEARKRMIEDYEYALELQQKGFEYQKRSLEKQNTVIGLNKGGSGKNDLPIIYNNQQLNEQIKIAISGKDAASKKILEAVETGKTLPVLTQPIQAVMINSEDEKVEGEDPAESLRSKLEMYTLAKGKIQELTDMMSIANGEEKAYLLEQIDIWKQYVNSLDGVTTKKEQLNKVSSSIEAMGQALSQMGQISDSVFGQMFSYIGGIAGAVAQAIPAIETLIAAQKAQANANAESAVSGAASSVSSIPFVGPMLAVAAAASVLAAIMNIPNFAEGGNVIGGSNYMDGITARVSSGEMIMNEADQKKLYNAIHSGELGGGSSRTVVTGEQIVTVVNNYGKRTGKGVILKG